MIRGHVPRRGSSDTPWRGQTIEAVSRSTQDDAAGREHYAFSQATRKCICRVNEQVGTGFKSGIPNQIELRARYESGA